MSICLSKSKYCRGIQCRKMLWMDEHMPEQAGELGLEVVFTNGRNVGDIARSYFGSYSVIEFEEDKNLMAENTKKLIENGIENIAEASFIYDGLYCAVDILHKNGDGFDIVEAKSSTSIKDIYIDDVAFQYYLLTQCGINVKKVQLMYINNSYERKVDLELDKLFVLEDCTEVTKQKAMDVSKNIAEIRAYVESKAEPQEDIGLHCSTPYGCAYYGYCARHIPQHSIFDIARMANEKKYEYYRQGIISFEDIIKSGIKLSERQRQQVEMTYYHKPTSIQPNEIKSFLETLDYPLYYLDFETFQSAIPEYDGLKPYEQIPFQYSLHIEQENGELEHKEFLAKEGTDPRRTIAERLCADIPKNVYVIVFNASFEKSIIKKLATTFPDLADHLISIDDNIHDLIIPFRKRYYYDEAMQGSYSIKSVLPSLYPENSELDYNALDDIHNGYEASAAFSDLQNHEPQEIAVIRENLLRYCRLDTLAMVKVMDKLRKCVR